MTSVVAVAALRPAHLGVLGVLAAAALVVLVAALVAMIARRRHVRRDPMTGLLSRAGLLARTTALPAGAVVAVVDFALLERVTDALGHARGEALLGVLADRLRAGCRRDGPAGASRAPEIARLVGDRFAVVLPGAGGDAAPSTERRLRDLRAALAGPCVVDGLPFEVPVVVGVAETAAGTGAGAGPGSAIATALRHADTALAAARRDGPPVRRWDPDLGERAARTHALIRGFTAAVAGGEVGVHYQPLVCLTRRTVVGVEALARWDHPELGPLLPDEFVPVLESTGQIGELTTVVLDQALAAARGWLDRGLRLSVAVNVPVADLTVSTFPAQVAAALAAHGVPADLLTLELTESGVAAERDAARPVLAGLRALGCRLAVDDFGTGQSSLAHLRGLPVDEVKIDKSFVLSMHTERGDSAVVRAIVEMGHTLGMTVVAEGVESPEVRAALVEMGCDVAQGYLVSRPLPALGLDDWLAGLDVAPDATEEGPLTLIA